MVWQRSAWCCLNTLFIYLIIATCSSKQSQNQQIVHISNFILEARPICWPISANQYYVLWHTLNKMNNNLQFIVGYHPWKAAAKHTGIITSRPTTLPTSPLSAGAEFDQAPS